MRYLQLNSRSLDTSKFLIKDYVSARNICGISLSETWGARDISPLESLGFKPVLKDRCHDNHGGVLTFHHGSTKYIPRYDLDIQALEAVWSETRMEGSPTLVCSVYIPPNQLYLRKRCLKHLSDVIKKTDHKYNLLIMGDFNARSYTWESWHTECKDRYDASFKFGECVISMCNELGLTIQNNGQYTRYQNGVKSAPDLTLTRGLQSLSWHVDHCINLRSDHCPILISIDEPLPGSITRWDLKNTNWNNWSKETDKCFDTFIRSYKAEQPADNVARNLTQTIISTAEDNIPKKSVCRHSKAFWSAELTDLVNRCKEAKKLYKKKSDPHNHDRYQEAVNKFKTLYNESKERNWESLCQELDPCDPHVWKKITKHSSSTHMANQTVIQPLTDGQGVTHFEDSKISSILTEAHISKPTKGPYDEDWKHTVDMSTSRAITAERTNLGNPQTELYNSDIQTSEVTWAISRLKPHSAPGPDRILPLMVLYAAPNKSAALQQTYMSCWKQGVVPEVWKDETRIYIPKPDKSTYNVAKSYRSLSLTSILGKIYERIAVSRLQHFMQSNGLYDQYQYAYQQNRNITQAIMFFSLNVLKGFKEGKDTLAAFIDLAGAFDNVWRQGLIFKLYEAGLRGRLFMYVVSYLTGRTVHSKVNNHTTESIPTYIGVPQGSVISPLLFIFYIREMTYSLERRISYADDLTAWVTSDHNTAVAQLKPQLETTMDWCHKWRQDVNLDKTVILLFTRGPSVNIHLQVRNHTLNQVDSIRCLGFELDSKLQFNQHINKVTSSALGPILFRTYLSCMVLFKPHKCQES